MEDTHYKSAKEEAERVYHAQPSIHSPFFREDVVLGLEGFRHLQYSARDERTKEEQISRFTLLPVALQVLKTATTLQGYRIRLVSASGRGSKRRGELPQIGQFWGFVAMFTDQGIKLRVVVRKLGDGKLHFWSVMRYSQEKMQRRFTG